MEMHRRYTDTMEAIATVRAARNLFGEAQAGGIWPATAVEIVHPSAPQFYDQNAARSYAFAQGVAWRESSGLLAAQHSERQPVLRLELCPSNIWLSDDVRQAADCFSNFARAVRRYPAVHNFRITALALQSRTGFWLASWQLPTDLRVSKAGRQAHLKSAGSIGLDAAEYEELVERALQKLPPPDQTEPSPHFRPAPSKQKLLRMASVTLQRMSDMLDLTADQLERAAAGEFANRKPVPATR